VSGPAEEEGRLLEARFERRLRTIGLFAGPLLALLVYFWNPAVTRPPGGGCSPSSA
jgi:hypothetical protein